MKVLISYASNSGSTYLVSQLIKETLVALRHDVVLQKSLDTQVKDVINADVWLVGSPSWKVNNKEGQPHEDILEMMSRLKDQNLDKKKVALFGCGDSAYLTFCGAVDELELFIKKVNAHQLVPSLKIDGFYFDIETNSKKTKAWATVLSEMFK